MTAAANLTQALDAAAKASLPEEVEWQDLDVMTRWRIKDTLLPVVTAAAEAVEAQLRQDFAREIRLIDEQYAAGKIFRPLSADAETVTDFANDFEWAARLVEGSL